MTAIEALTAGRPFAFSRWGDGEWSAILGRKGANCDGQEYTEDLGEALRNVLRARPTYMLGMQPLARRRFGPEIDAWLEAEGLSDLEWTDAGVFHSASIMDRMGPVFDALAQPGVILVGPRRLAGLVRYFPIHRHVVVPERDAWAHFGQWATATGSAIATSVGTVAISAGMGANALVDQIHRAAPDRIAVDFGSVFEPYVGHSNRRYHDGILKREAKQ